MTSEEAISVLKETIDPNVDKSFKEWKEWDQEKHLPAVEMAIEALSADTVSREQYDHVCEEYNRLVHKAVCIKLCDENCEYEKGKTCYHAREHSAIGALQTEVVQGVGRYENAMQKLREMPKYLSGIKEKLMQARPEYLNPQQKKLASYNQRWNDALDEYIDRIKEIPSADRLTGKWIPVKWHEITDEEREREGYPEDWVVHIDCEMPCDEQEILIQTKNGYIRWDVCYEDGEFSLDSGWDWVEDILAWMPLPMPYREDSEE